MKKLFHFIYLILLVVPVFTENIPGLPPISDQELDELIKMIEGLPPEVRDELTKTGEEIIKRADALGQDPFELIAKAAEHGQDVFAYTDQLAGTASTPSTQQEVSFTQPEKKETKTAISERAMSSLQELIGSLIEALASFQEKLTGDATKKSHAKAYEFVINDMIFYLETLNIPHLLAYLDQPEFKVLKANLERFQKELTHLESAFILEEYSLEGVNPYQVLNLTPAANEDAVVKAYQQRMQSLQREKSLASHTAIGDIEAAISELNNSYEIIRRKKEAEFLFNNILSTIAHAADSLMIIEDIKKLLTRYEPETLAAQKAREDLEAMARREQAEARRIAPTPYIPTFTMPESSKKSSFNDYFGGFDDYKSPFDYEPSAGTLGGGGAQVKEKDAAAKKKDEGKKAPEKKKEDVKKKDEKGKEGAKKEETPRSVGEAVAIVKDRAKELEKMLEKTISDKKDLAQALISPEWITKPFDPAFAKNYNDLIAALRQQLEAIDKKEELAFDKALKTPTEKAAYTKDVAKIWADFEKTDPFTKLGKFIFTIGLSTTPQDTYALPSGQKLPITPEYRYLAWGGDLNKIAEPQQDTAAQPTTKQIVAGMNPLKDTVDAQGNTVKQGTNRIKELHDLYKKIKEAKEPKKKPEAKKN